MAQSGQTPRGAENVIGELEYAEQLSQKIRMLLPGTSGAASPESLYLREQALRTMSDLQAHMESTCRFAPHSSRAVLITPVHTSWVISFLCLYC
jgi:hypothetical protein